MREGFKKLSVKRAAEGNQDYGIRKCVVPCHAPDSARAKTIPFHTGGQ